MLARPDSGLSCTPFTQGIIFRIDGILKTSQMMILPKHVAEMAVNQRVVVKSVGTIGKMRGEPFCGALVLNTHLPVWASSRC